MRCWFPLLLLIASCGGKSEAPASDDPTTHVTIGGTGGSAEVAPKKVPIDHRLLPGLAAADNTGATGKATWVTAFGGLQSDTPRGLAVSPTTGDVYVCGFFEGESSRSIRRDRIAWRFSS